MTEADGVKVEAPGASNPIGYRFVPTAELGMTFTGEPILRLGSFDMTPNGANLEVSNAQGESFCGRNLPLCNVGGVAIIAVIIAVAAPSRDSDELLGPYPYPPPIDRAPAEPAGITLSSRIKINYESVAGNPRWLI